MRVLFIGDVVGPRAVEWLAERLPGLRAEHAVDLAVVNAENCGADAASMTVVAVERLLAAGVDVITGGNHAFDGAEVEAVLAHERVLRPLNVGEEVPGRGTLTLGAAGEAVRVVVLADRDALDFAPPLARMTLDAYSAWSALAPGPTTIVDMHAQSVAAKQGLAYALDGQVAAVLGTHTHEPTLPLHLLAGGTALVTDVGMTGPSGGPQGMDAQGVVARIRGLLASELPPGPAYGEIVLGAVLLEIREGLTRSVVRLGSDGRAAPAPAGFADVGATDVFASIPVGDRDAAVSWYGRLLGRPPDLIPNEDEAAWRITDSGWIYVIADAARAGSSLQTLLVADLDALLASVAARGVAIGPVDVMSNGVRHTTLTDPDGNRLKLGQVPRS
jgi:calcineurin-like phosphoesterase/predicted enzyme related to lactoylglutathione lyase